MTSSRPFLNMLNPLGRNYRGYERAREDVVEHRHHAVEVAVMKCIMQGLEMSGFDGRPEAALVGMVLSKRKGIGAANSFSRRPTFRGSKFLRGATDSDPDLRQSPVHGVEIGQLASQIGHDLRSL